MKYIVDYIVFGSLLYLALSGWQKGFLRTVVQPVSIVLAIGLATVYYRQTHHMVRAIAIGMFAPVVLSVVLTLLLRIRRPSPKDVDVSQWFSRFLGSIVSVGWGGFFLVSGLLFIALLPLRIPIIESLQDRVLQSRSYELLYLFCHKNIPHAADLEETLSALRDPAYIAQIQSTEEFKRVYRNPHIQTLLTDERIAEYLKTKNLPALLKDPRVQAVFKDQLLIEDVTTLHKAVFQSLTSPETPLQMYRTTEGTALKTRE